MCLSSDFHWMKVSLLMQWITKIMLNRLLYSLSITCTVFKWFISYLINGTQSVSVGHINSLSLPLKYGVAQGSFLGPILFTLRAQLFLTKVESTIIVTGSLCTIRSLLSQPTEFQCLAPDFQSRFVSVKSWILSEKLKLNDEKAEATQVESRQAQI